MPASHLRKAFSITLRTARILHIHVLLLVAIALFGILGVSGVNAAQIQSPQSVQGNAPLAQEPVSAQKSTITTSATEARDDGATPITVVVTALDDFANPLPSMNVNLFVTGSAVINPVSSVTDTQGKAVFEVTDAVTETVMVTAEVDGVLIDSSAQIRFHCRIDGDLTVVSGDTCSLDADSYTFDNLLVQTGGTLLIKGNTSSKLGVTINAATVTVETGGAINADKTGYPSSSGPGAGHGAVWTGGGAGYGGIGQNGSGSGGAAYGSVTEPGDLGSGGGWGQCGLISRCPGGAGGGSVHLIVSGALKIDGTISADGVAGGGRSGGGAGGSIWIETNALEGSGLIHANGGSGLNGGGSGAGGRVAVYYASSAFPLDWGHVYARGNYQTTNGGGPGTLYLKDTIANTDKLVVNNGGNSVTTYAVHLPGDYAYDQIELSGKGTLRISGSTSRFTLTGNNVLVGDGTGKLQVEGTIITSPDLLLSDVALTILGNIEGAQNITLEAPGVLELYATSPLHAGSYSFTSITVRDGATLKLVSSGNGDTDYSNDPGVKLHLTNLTVEPGGKVSADGTGYPGAHESGTGPGAGKSAWATGGGGGHGGYGQNAAGAGGTPYDSVTNPILPGSSGGAGQDIYHNTLPGGAGGGAIWLVVSDTLQVDGEISADGVIGSGRSGGGSGGSILIETTNLTGTGSIHANGGPNSGGGDGGGGRIAIYATSNVGSVSYSAQGGPIWRTGGEGTIFLNNLDPEHSSVQISPTSVVADGIKTGNVTVTLIDVDGNPMPDKLVELALFSGPSLSLNGQSLGLYQYVSIGQTDANGVVTAQLSATTIGARTLKARSGQESVTQLGTVEFIEQPAIPSVREESVVSSGASGDECDDCIGCPVNNTQGTAGGPINTRTGGYDYTETDLSFVTTAGELSFVRTYASLTLDQPTNLSPGWTHNQDMRLIFPDDPGGQPGTVLLKSRSANQYAFLENSNGSYEAAPGIRAKLVRTSATEYTVTDSGQNEYVFDENGRMMTYANPQGYIWEYTYDASGNLTHVNANGGASYLDFSYDAQGRIASVGDHSGRSVSYGYDAAGDLVSVTDVLGQTWTYNYDAAHRLTQVTAPDQSIVEHTEYDSLGRAVRQYDGEGELVLELTFNADGSTTITDALGNTQTHTYDDRGTLVGETDAVDAEKTTEYGYNFQPTQVSNAAGHTLTMTWSEDGSDLLSKTDPAGNVTSNTYDALHNLTSTTDPLGNTTTYTYDGKLMTGSMDALSGVTSYTYTPEGYLASATDPAERTTSYTYNQSGQRASMTDPSGQTWTYTYDSLGRLTDTTDPRGRIAHTEYDAAGRIVRSVQNYDLSRLQNAENLYNIVTEYQYNVRGQQVVVTNTYSQTTQYVYDNAGRLIQTIDALGNVSTSEYDAAGRLIVSIDARGNRTTYTYDAKGRLLSTTNALGISSGTTTFDIPTNTSTVTNAAGAATTFYYDELGRVVKTVDALGNATTTTYDANGNVATRADQLGRVTRYEYDELNRLVKTIDPNGGVTETVYNEKGQRIAAIDTLGRQTTYTYDEQGRLVATTDPLGRVTSTEYDQYGRQAASVDLAGQRTTYTYDLLDRVIATTDPAGNVTRTQYDALGRAISRTDASGNVTTTTYDELGRVVSVQDASGGTITNAYDAVGNLLATTDQAGQTTSYGYDALNRRVSVTDPLGNTTRTTYDRMGRVSSIIDANGVVTYMGYDILGRQTSLILNYQPTVPADAETNVTYTYSYNAVGNRVSVSDAGGNLTSYGYDSLNRVTSKADPLGNTWAYNYDAGGNLVSSTDANGTTIGYTYDTGGQLTTIDYPDPDADVSFTYTESGQRASMTDGLGTTTWSYDELGRLVSVTDPFGKTVSYEYDANGNRTGLTYPDGKFVAYVYDSENRLTLVTDWEGGQTGYEYDSAGQLATLTRPNGVDSEYVYNEAGNLIELRHKAGSVELASYRYNYDQAGRLIRAVEDVSQPLPPTPTPTATFTETATPTSTNTSTPTNTFTPTNTSTPTDTPTSTFTPTPTVDQSLEALQQCLQEYIDSGDVDAKIGKSLQSKLENVAKSLEKGNLEAASNQLDAFANEVEAQYGKKISEAAADDLIARAQEIIGRLASLPSETATPDLTQSPCMTPALTPLEAIESLQACVTYYIEAEEIDAKIEESLSSKLQNAADSLGDEQFEAAIGELGAFINEVEAQHDKKISDLAADDLTAQARMAFVLFTPTPTLEPTLAPTEVPTNTPTLVTADTETPSPTVIPSPTDTLLPTETLIPTQTFTPLPTATLVLPAGPLTIDYTYDSLNRLKSAEYSDGRGFGYEYDVNGNTVEKRENLGTETVTTTYTYDAANQLVTAQKDLTIWEYTYDANGSLIEVLPNGNEVSSAKRYTYNTAGFLIKVEEHDGSNWNIQAEMSYNGMGERLSMNASGISSQYALDGSQVLTAESDGNATTYLYGLGPVAEKTTEWNYLLSDASNTPRQLTSPQGYITLSTRYDPWGSTLELQGTGNFTYGYFGGLLDVSTGLIYVGNGQYYDPSTGRFLTRGTNPNNPNPYVPRDPIGALIAPLGLLAIFYSGKKRKANGALVWIVFLIAILMSVSMACSLFKPSPAASAPTPASEPAQPPVVTQTSTPTPASTQTHPEGTEPASPTEQVMTDSACPCGPETRENVIIGVTRVLYKEGASTFSEFDRSLKVFERLVWATRSIKIHPELSTDHDYETLVKSSRYSAAGAYDTPFTNEEPYKNIARRILSEENSSQVPPEFRNQFVQWMSPQLFPRRAVGHIQIFVDPEVPGCGWSDPQVCQLPDLRYVNNFRNSDIGSLTEERFIELGALDPFDTHEYVGNPDYDKPDDPHDGANDGKVVFEQSTYFDSECYWAGLYFMYKNEHQSLVELSKAVANNYVYPTASNAGELSCGAYQPAISN